MSFSSFLAAAAVIAPQGTSAMIRRFKGQPSTPQEPTEADKAALAKAEEKRARRMARNKNQSKGSQ